MNILNIKEKIYYDRIDEDFNELSWTIGIQYKDMNNNQIGISYIKSPLFRDSFMYEDNKIKIDGKMPDKLQFGILYSFNPHFGISLDLTNVYWHQRSDDLYNFADISGSIRTNITKQISFSLGFLSTGYNSDLYYFDLNSNLRGFYLLGGLNLRLRHYDIDLAFAKNTESSGDWRKQKIGKITIGFYL
jgi:long-subunit fatty acid transport protein